MPANEQPVAEQNRAQEQAWDGDEGQIWAEHADFFETSVREHQAALMAAARITSGERVLDVGCGTGGSSLEAAAAAGPGRVLGIDLSAAMLERARAAAAASGLSNVTFVRGDAQIWPFDPASFDVVISRTGAMFFADQVAAFSNIGRALRPGGRLALVSWREPQANEWIASFAGAMTLGRGLDPPPPGAPSPFAHADPARVRQILGDAGFDDVHCEPRDLPMTFGSTVDEGFDVMVGLLSWMSAKLTAPERDQAMGRLRLLLEQHLRPEGVVFGSAAWVITAVRR
jgi:SAM-dependent methyltransferase